MPNTPTESALVMMYELEPGDESPLHQLRLTPESPLITGEIVEMGGKRFVAFKNLEQFEDVIAVPPQKN